MILKMTDLLHQSHFSGVYELTYKYFISHILYGTPNGVYGYKQYIYIDDSGRPVIDFGNRVEFRLTEITVSATIKSTTY